MEYFLGIDTSNYTTSAALYNADQDRILMKKRLLPVKNGELGLRQSDAVFAHVNSLGNIIAELFCGVAKPGILSVGVSVRPRNAEGSYMPCFLAGKMAAQSISSAVGCDCFEFSHQEGHIAAALYSSGGFNTVRDEFYAFHVSGGTTELLLVNAADCGHGGFSVKIVGRSLDLKAGQAIDRVGKMLSLPFPSGIYIDKLARDCGSDIKVNPTLKGGDCCLSGIENQAQSLINSGKPPEYTAKFCIKSIQAAVEAMVFAAFGKYGEKPVVFAGGVMSNSVIRRCVTQKLGKLAYFSKPEFSSDNAAGIAILAGRLYNRRQDSAKG